MTDSAPDGDAYRRFHELVRTLRERCPWDREQTHDSLVPYLIEETYEVVDAIAARTQTGTDDDLIEELGDLWFQIEFHAAIAEEENRFTIDDVVTQIHDKLVRRHPHVFDDPGSDVPTPDALAQDWESLKRAEKPERTSIFDGIANSLPSLSYAREVQSKAARRGFDWPTVEQSAAKVTEELAEVREAANDSRTDRVSAEIGDLLFSVVNLARHHGVDPESALRAATNTFRHRFGAVEEAVASGPTDWGGLSPDELVALWNEAKLTTQQSPPNNDTKS